MICAGTAGALERVEKVDPDLGKFALQPLAGHGQTADNVIGPRESPQTTHQNMFRLVDSFLEVGCIYLEGYMNVIH